MHSLVGLNINYGTNPICDPISGKFETLDLELLSTLGVRSLQVGDNEELYYDLLPPFRYPSVVRNLSLTGAITDYKYFALVTPLTGLSEICLHFAALSELTIGTSHVESFSVLKCLRISTAHVEASTTSDEAVVTVVENCIQLLQLVRSSRLERLLLDIPFSAAHEESMNCAILDCLVNHSYSIQYLQIYYGILAADMEVPMSPQMIRSFYKDMCRRLLDHPVRKTALSRIQLKRTSIASPTHVNNFSLWSQVIQRQKKLKELFYLNLTIEGVAEGCRCIQMNKDTLTKVLLHVGDMNSQSPTIVLDGSVFNSCVNLTHVLIRGRRLTWRLDNDQANLWLTRMPKLRNAKELPKRLVLLSIRDIEVGCEDLHETLKGMHKLRKLRCMDIGMGDNQGMWAEDLWTILNDKRMDEIEISRAVNRESVNVMLGTTGLDHVQEHIMRHVRDYATCMKSPSPTETILIRLFFG